jgi:D-alanyl-D-alanine carboxypeptidase
LVADIDTGDVYAERAAGEKRPIASVTKLMTALVANEVISFDKKLSIPQGILTVPPIATSTEPRTFVVEDLLYALLLQSNNKIAEALASYYGSGGFVRWMNTTAKAIGMNDTTYADASGISANNISTTEDLYRQLVYLSNKKSFVLKITHTAQKNIIADEGQSYTVYNVNRPATDESFEGGKAGHTTAAADTFASVLNLTVGGQSRRIAIVVLGSQNQIADTNTLEEWIKTAATLDATQAACLSCAAPTYRKISI